GFGPGVNTQLIAPAQPKRRDSPAGAVGGLIQLDLGAGARQLPGRTQPRNPTTDDGDLGHGTALHWTTPLWSALLGAALFRGVAVITRRRRRQSSGSAPPRG